MKISVVGLGKLGAPLAAVLSSKGHKVVGVDTQQSVVDCINEGVAPVDETGLQNLMSHYHFHATMKMDAVASTDMTFIIVPTPSEESGRFSNEYVLDAVARVGLALNAKDGWHLVVVASTVMPGSMEGDIKRVLELSRGVRNTGLVYSPQFIALGSVIENMLYPDMLLVGENGPRSGREFEEVMRTVVGPQVPIQHMTLTEAEITKIAVNSFITTKISFANHIGEIAERFEVRADVITEALGLDHRIGTAYLTSGTPYGGPCLPRDNRAFAVTCPGGEIALAADEVNNRQIERFAGLAEGQAVAVLGLSYKPNTSVYEESAGLKLAKLLSEIAKVRVFDPAVKSVSWTNDFIWCNTIESALHGTGTVFIMTPWPEFADVEIPSHVKIVDPWGVR